MIRKTKYKVLENILNIEFAWNIQIKTLSNVLMRNFNCLWKNIF